MQYLVLPYKISDLDLDLDEDNFPDYISGLSLTANVVLQL